MEVLGFYLSPEAMFAIVAICVVGVPSTLLIAYAWAGGKNNQDR